MPSPDSALHERAIAEVALRVAGPDGELVGVYTPATDGSTERCAVLLARPRAHRNRVWVHLARRLAAGDVAALRFDYAGHGDSEGVAALAHPCRPRGADVAAVMDHARAQLGAARFALAGNCFDARSALAGAALRPSLTAGVVLGAMPVMDLPGMERAATAPHDDPPPLDAGFVADLAAFAAADARALFLYGEIDAELPAFRVAQRAALDLLPPGARARIEVEVWGGRVHGLLEVARQEAFIRRVAAWIRGLPWTST